MASNDTIGQTFELQSKSKELGSLSKEELVEKIRQLEAHVFQLKNIIAKKNNENKKSNKQKKQREFDFSKYNTRHVALKIAYLGWDYQGLAVQEDTDNTIESAMFEALHRTKLIESRETSNYHRCGRTDKGVSAFGQVISIDLRSNMSEGVGVKAKEEETTAEKKGEKTAEIPYCKLLNKVLPAEIRVLAWCPVDINFSARFSCLKRTYKYFFPKGNLDIQAMRLAARKLHGTHDFRNLCKMDVANGVVNFTRNIHHTDISAKDDSVRGYTMCELTVVGQAFLWHQIRCIVAVLFLIGQGKENPEIIDELLDVDKQPRKPQYTMASELPLCLFDSEYEGVDWIYDQDWHIENIQHLQEQWAVSSIKSTMIRAMLDHLPTIQPSSSTMDNKNERLPPEDTQIENQAQSLVPGNKPRNYIPLLQRQKCESLEDRIQHFTKRRKIAKD